MNSGFSDFQDLLNTTTSGEAINAVKTELIALEEEVADNTADITNNTVNISNNSTAISNNLVLINNNTGSINTNAAAISTNTSDISSNATNIASNTSSIATNTAAISSNATNIASNTSSIATNTSQLTFQLNLISDVITLVNDNANNITNHTVLIANNTTAIANNHHDITSNNGSINTNRHDITTNTSSIATNASNIATNTADIAAIDADVSGKLSKSGDTMSGVLNMGGNNITNVGLVDGFDLTTFDSDITSLALNLGTETTRALNAEAALATDIATINLSIPQITTNQADILSNFSNITINAAAIASHGIQIADNVFDISQLDQNKFNVTGGTIYGNIVVNGITCSSLNNLSSTELEYLNGVTSSVQTQLSNKQNVLTNGVDTLTSSEVNQLKNIGTYVISSTDWRGLQYMGNVTYDVNGKFNAKQDTLTNGVQNLTSAEVTQLANIGTYSITSAAWRGAQYLGNVTYDVNTKFNGKQNVLTNGVDTLAAAEVNQLKNIGTYVISSTDWRGLQYMGSVTYDVNGKFNAKQDTLTNGVETLTSSEVNQLKNINTSVISSTDWRGLQYMGSVTYDVNGKFNEKLNLSGGTMTGFLTTQGAHVDGTLFTASGYSGLMPGSIARKQLRIQHPFSTSYGWNIGNQASVSTSSSDMDLYFSVSRGNYGERVAAALWDQSGGTGRINFTGQHRCQPMFEFKDDMVGLIVESTGRYMNFIKEGEECSQITCIQINDSLPMVRLCTEEKSKKVFGVISSEEEKNRNYQVGVFTSFYDKVDGDTRLYINGLGEGAIWVCNANGNLENGDYICAAGVAGYGMRQDSEFLANYTVAKITMACDFDPQLEETKKWVDGVWVMTGEFKPQYEMFELDDGMRVAFVGCTYHCS
jgi:hypothetical protein